MILIWGVPNDSPIRAVCTVLEANNEPVLLVNQFDAAHSDICFDPADPGSGTLTFGGKTTRLTDISAIYFRPYETGRVLSAGNVVDPAAREHVYSFDNALLVWIELASAIVVNRPSAMTSNSSKPLQSALIAKAGFRVPTTLLTSDVGAASDFLARFGKVIYKSTGGVRSCVSHLNEKVIQRLGCAACPLQLQEYIDGTDYRVHVIGDSAFASRIACSAVDYRYPAAPDQAPVIEPMKLPADLEAQCVHLAREVNLTFTGIDLRQSTDGSWVCFEANPSPGYTYYEDETSAPITHALASLLASRYSSNLNVPIPDPVPVPITSRI